MKKTELRKLYIQKRSYLDDVNQLSIKLIDQFFSEIKLDDTQFIHVYIPIKQKYEVNTWELIRRIWDFYPEINIVVPVSDFDNNDMKSVLITPDTKFEEKLHGIVEPVSGEVISDSKIDMVITPLLIHDQQGYRVGYGKGFYDRFFLNKCRANVRRVGLSFFEPISCIEDVSEYDVCLTDFIYLPNDIS